MDISPIDRAALLQAAGLPPDSVQGSLLIDAVAEICAGICALAEPDGDAAHVSKADASAVGAELSAEILARFQVG